MSVSDLGQTLSNSYLAVIYGLSMLVLKTTFMMGEPEDHSAHDVNSPESTASTLALITLAPFSIAASHSAVSGSFYSRDTSTELNMVSLS